MRFPVIAVVCALLVGCVTSQYFAPNDPKLAREDLASCGGEKYGYAELASDSRRAVRISMTPTEQQLSVVITVLLQPGDMFKLLQPSLSLRTESLEKQEVVAPLNGWRDVTSAAYGIKARGFITPADSMIEVSDFSADPSNIKSLRRYGFEASATVKIAPAQNYVLTIPSFELNGARHSPLSIPMERREHTNIPSCLQ